ncbi:triphosphoribosyl-dephospho-CoA synthase [Candidatus Halobonum tyrrellensis]|uniref:Triphosphoribosyl-dephospho-CoA synthetase n=1 Tax=Candidatus Halobonum tyrrellensis G22 TaxID=1324957 RepID=V4GVB6_9EURY|nr:triphosphoribosyl-dephospho-CoA synthase [Candidatus Halobonum tyrrellensis]ESP89106.1 triphosphoribosyl-dephospho-CoA synthetase [Candidatus Halobonum tyrrellensis G22]
MTADPDAGAATRGPAANAELALLLEVAGTPKPGNVDRRRDFTDLRFDHFLAGAVGARPGLERAAAGAPVGEAFELAVEGMSEQSGGNTQFGCLLLLVPLVRAAAAGDLTRERARAVCAGTTVDDAAGFYRAFERVDVSVADPPADAEELDVRRGADAVPALRERGLTLADVMARSADGDAPDANAREWRDGFPRSFRAAEGVLADDGPASDRAARAFLDLLGEAEDTLVRVEHGPEVAAAVRDRAAEVEDLEAAEAWAEELVDRGINPGTTADLTAAALFVALERGLSV